MNGLRRRVAALVRLAVVAAFMVGLLQAPGALAAPTPIAPSGDECDFFESITGGCLEPGGSSEEATNAETQLFAATTPCHNAVLSFYPSNQARLFKWSDNHVQPQTSGFFGEVPSQVRLEFRAIGTNVLVRPGYPGYHTPGTDAAAGQASFDLMELHETGHTNWLWYLVDPTGHQTLGKNYSGNDVKVSSVCSFSIEYSNPKPAVGTYTYKAEDPCDETVVMKEADPHYTFHFSTSSPNGLRMQFVGKNGGAWEQFAAPDGVVKSAASIDLKELVDAGGTEWNWRVVDATWGGEYSSNVCAFKIDAEKTSAPSPPPPQGPPGFTQQPSYGGDCKERPAGTVCLAYPDGYVWLVSDSIIERKELGSWEGKPILAVIGGKAEYHHVSGTTWVKQVPK